MYDIIIIGGGAAGYFSAIHAASCSKNKRIAVLEQGKNVLQKVKISGGGRCNVTHAAFDPHSLCLHYPRGAKELLGPFTKFAPGDTMAWFEDRGVPLKIENDNRVFPVSDSSLSIINALTSEAQRLNVEILLQHKAMGIEKHRDYYQIQLLKQNSIKAKQVILAPGSAPKVYDWVEKLGLKMQKRVPSLFTFKVNISALHDLKGLSVPAAEVKLNTGHTASGPLLITHWGFSGPAVLRLSAEAAFELFEQKYNCMCAISWTGSNVQETLEQLREYKAESGKKTLRNHGYSEIPKRLWEYFIKKCNLDIQKQWANLSKQELQKLAEQVAQDQYKIEGQTRFKEEFVTAGGIALDEINFKTFELKKHPGLYAVGELLNIDGVTGGFNFQAAWTGGYLAGNAAGKSTESH